MPMKSLGTLVANSEYMYIKPPFWIDVLVFGLAIVVWFQTLLAQAEAATEDYDEDKDVDRVTEDPGYKDEVSDMHFKAGQSKRVWGELYKVCILFPTVTLWSSLLQIPPQDIVFRKRAQCLPRLHFI